MNLTHLQTPVNVLSRCGAVYFRSVLIEVYEQTFLFSSFLYYFAFLLTLKAVVAINLLLLVSQDSYIPTIPFLSSFLLLHCYLGAQIHSTW